MSEQLLTKCPHCSTTFRLTQEQLAIAGGAVRCGACYQVFHAKEHIVKTSVIEEVREEPAPTPPPQPQPDPFKTLNAPEEDDPYAEMDWDTNLDIDAQTSPDADLFDEEYQRKILEEDENFAEFGLDEIAKPAKKDSNDESWAEQLLEELGDDDSEDDDGIDEERIQDNPKRDNEKSGQKKSNTGFGSISSGGSAFEDDMDDSDKESSSDFSDSFMELDSVGTSASMFEMEDENTSTNSNDESWAQKMLEELESEGQPVPPSMAELAILMDDKPTAEDDSKKDGNKKASESSPKAPPNTRPKNSDANAKSNLDFETTDFLESLKAQAEEIEIGEIPTFLDDDDGDDSSPALRDMRAERPKPVLQKNFQASTIHLEAEQDKTSIVKALGWAALCLLAIATLVGQYAYYNRVELSANPDLRPHLKQICEIFNCTLPSQSDVSLIKGSNLVVRSHSMEKGALVIDAILHNRAEFVQPFPVVELIFEDRNNKLIASRRFKPIEYIHNEALDLKEMPPNTPIRFTLEILDPGSEAVNYQIRFHPANSPI